LGVDPVVYNSEQEAAFVSLLRELGLKAAPILEKLNQTRLDPNNRRRWIKLADIDLDQYESIKARGVKGVYGNQYYERFYPAGNFAAHLVGYVNRDNQAVMGVEQWLDFYLGGQSGWRETEADARRRELAQFRVREVEARPGYDVELTIDLVVQSYVEEALKKIAEKYDPAGATIIVSDPMTGDILGLGNYPSFDPNMFWESEIEAQRNRAVSDLYEPGSTFKIVAVGAALEERIAYPKTMIDCGSPTVEYRGRTLSLPSDSKNYDELSLTEVVAKSSNRGAAQLGLRLGEKRLHDYAAKFGFGESTQWSLNGEAKGTLHDVKDWDGLTITRLPAGYAVNATPMQVHLAMAAVANNGNLMRPRIVKRVVDGKGNTVVDFPRRSRRQVISHQSAKTLSAMLTGVVSDTGTARRAIIPGFDVAGKTGTARKIIDGHYSTRNHYASFAGYFPANAPRVAITIMVDDANVIDDHGNRRIAYGGVVAAPVFKEIGEKLVEYYALAPTPKDQGGMLASLRGRSVP
jgi:cell division protein FtsI/penicillin-binding protein 2